MKRLLFVALPILLGAWIAQVPAGGGGGCTPTSFTVAGDTTWVADCTATVTWEAWGGGAAGSGSATATAPGGGGGAYAKGSISVTSGTTYNVRVGAGVTGGTGTSGNAIISYICPQSNGTCAAGMGACSDASGLTTADFVCASFGTGTTNGVGAGGLAANSVGGVATANGGDGGNGAASVGGGGGGAGGVSGAGTAGTAGGGAGGGGGSGDAGSGGAGGTSGGAGAANALGGGGGGGIGAGPGGAGGAPGAAGGGAWNSGNGGNGATGKVAVTP